MSVWCGDPFPSSARERTPSLLVSVYSIETPPPSFLFFNHVVSTFFFMLIRVSVSLGNNPSPPVMVQEGSVALTVRSTDLLEFDSETDGKKKTKTDHQLASLSFSLLLPLFLSTNHCLDAKWAPSENETRRPPIRFFCHVHFFLVLFGLWPPSLLLFSVSARAASSRRGRGEKTPRHTRLDLERFSSPPF